MTREGLLAEERPGVPLSHRGAAAALLRRQDFQHSVPGSLTSEAPAVPLPELALVRVKENEIRPSSGGGDEQQGSRPRV